MERFALDPPHSPPFRCTQNPALARSVINGPARRRRPRRMRAGQFAARRQAPWPAHKRRGPPASAAARPLPMLGRPRPHPSPSARRPARKCNNPSHIRQQQRDLYDSDYRLRPGSGDELGGGRAGAWSFIRWRSHRAIWLGPRRRRQRAARPARPERLSRTAAAAVATAPAARGHLGVGTLHRYL